MTGAKCNRAAHFEAPFILLIAVMDDTLRFALTKLTQSGKTPTVAQLKAQLAGHNYPLPLLIKALQQWKVAPTPLTEAPEAIVSEPSQDALTIAALKAEIDTLKRDMSEIKAELARLTQQ